MDKPLYFNEEGLDQLLKRIKYVGNDMRFRGGRSALRKAGNVVVKSAKQNAEALDDPSTPQKISKNITQRWSGRHFRRTGDLKFRIGVRGGGKTRKRQRKDIPGWATPHWHFFEFGTEKMPAKPLIRSAANQNAQKVVDTFAATYSQNIQRRIQRIRGR